MADRVDSSSLDVNAEGKPELAVSPVDLHWLGSILWDGPPPSRDHFKASSANREPTSVSTVEQHVSDLSIDDGDDPRQIDASTAPLPAQGIKKRNSVSLVLKPSQKAAKNATANDQNSEPASSQTPGETRVKTGKIVVRLGGAPEYGDPHYIILVDGRQIANGNIDWSMGIPVLNEQESESFICWQDVAIEWDFSDGLPQKISLTYDADHAGPIVTSCLLISDWVEVDGLKILTSGNYAHVDGQRTPWPQQNSIWSWTGELTFDVSGAFKGVVNELATDQGTSEFFDVGNEIKRKFFRDVIGQASAKSELTQTREDQSEPVQMDRQPLGPALQQEKPKPVPEREARQNVEAFYGAVLKRALDQLQDSISRGRHSQSLLLSKGSNAQASTHKSAQMARAKGYRLKTQFFQKLLSKAKSRAAIEPSTARP